MGEKADWLTHKGRYIEIMKIQDFKLLFLYLYIMFPIEDGELKDHRSVDEPVITFIRLMILLL